VDAADSPLWRRVFDDVERRVGRPLAAATSSSDFHEAALKLRRLRRAVVRPVHSAAGLGLHLVGLPSHSEVRELRRELSEVQREMSAMRRERIQAERDQQGSE
jgi:DNA transposition AAA+ family ATPase